MVRTRLKNGFGEIIKEIRPVRETITSWYDGGGNLTKTVDADSIETDFTYDAANRRTAMSSPGAISAAYAYDATSGGNFGIGRLTSASVASDSVAYVYDAQGRVISDSKCPSGWGLWLLKSRVRFVSACPGSAGLVVAF